MIFNYEININPSLIEIFLFSLHLVYIFKSCFARVCVNISALNFKFIVSCYFHYVSGFMFGTGFVI